MGVIALQSDERADATTALGEVLVSASGMAKAFSGVPALIDGRIELQRGSVHALCGGNGAGKSTFLNILMGIIRADAGQSSARAARSLMQTRPRRLPTAWRITQSSVPCST